MVDVVGKLCLDASSNERHVNGVVRASRPCVAADLAQGEYVIAKEKQQRRWPIKYLQWPANIMSMVLLGPADPVWLQT